MGIGRIFARLRLSRCAACGALIEKNRGFCDDHCRAAYARRRAS